MAIDVGPNRSAIGKFGGYKPAGVGMRPPNPINKPPAPMPNPMMGATPPMSPPMGNQMGGFLPGGVPPTGPQSANPMPPPRPAPLQSPIDVAPSGYTDPNSASIPDISMGNMGQSQGATGMGGLWNAYNGAGPNLSTRPFRNKLFY